MIFGYLFIANKCVCTVYITTDGCISYVFSIFDGEFVCVCVCVSRCSGTCVYINYIFFDLWLIRRLLKTNKREIISCACLHYSPALKSNYSRPSRTDNRTYIHYYIHMDGRLF